VTFLAAGLLLLLVAVPLMVGVYAWSQRRRRPVAARYSSLLLIHAAAPGSSRLRRHLPFGLFAVALATLGVAIARPAVVLSVPANGTTVMVAMDVSGSMCSTDIAPTRLDVAKDAAVRFVENQASRTNIGIVAFSGLAAVIEPPTTDRTRLVDAIRSLTTGRRTAVGSGILASIDAIADIDPSVSPSITRGRPGPPPDPVAPGDHAPAIIVVLTDGASNAGPEPLEAGQQAVDRGIRVFTIGYGTASGGAMSGECRQRFTGSEPFGAGGFGGGAGGGRFRRGIDEDTLIAIAQLTGGQYFPAESASELIEVFGELPTTSISAHEVVEVSVAFAGLGALLGAAALLLGRAWRPLP
jgi:Ca-activated chloride channel family protein